MQKDLKHCSNYITYKMCGILALLNNGNHNTEEEIDCAVTSGKPRGPESTHSLKLNNISMHFHRLAINGLESGSDQPLQVENITLICNGEIYNYKELFTMIGVTPKTNSDCEIIAHLYLRYGAEKTLQMLDGVFGFVLHENMNGDNNPSRIVVARDPFGIRPLFKCEKKGENYQQDYIAFSSEVKALSELTKNKQNVKMSTFQPGSYSLYEQPFDDSCYWHETIKNRKYHNLTWRPSVSDKNIQATTLCKYANDIVVSLCKAVRKRVMVTDRPVACLLSGGLDSSLIAALAKNYYIGDLHTYSIGMKGSKDLENARLVADHIGSIHHEVVLTSDEFFNAIPNVIKNIESFDTTTVRASVGNYLVGKYISENSDAKVILNGDGSDEVAGGYIYFLAAPNDLAFDQECRRLLDDIHYFDVLRSDRSISSNGLEPRTPFLDRTFVDTYMSIPANVRNPRSFENRNNNIWDKHAMDYKIKGMDDIASIIKSRPEKLLLRWSFDNLMPNLLPSSVLWRSKEAFSDGVSGDSGSWFEIIHANLNGNDDRMDTYKHFGTEGHMPPTTIEQLYYRRIFCQLYPNCDTTTPYFWMPKWVNATDASARTLKFYTDR